MTGHPGPPLPPACCLTNQERRSSNAGLFQPASKIHFSFTVQIQSEPQAMKHLMIKKYVYWVIVIN